MPSKVKFATARLLGRVRTAVRKLGTIAHHADSWKLEPSWAAALADELRFSLGCWVHGLPLSVP